MLQKSLTTYWKSIYSSTKIPIFFILFFSLVLYSNSLSNNYALDDDFAIYKNTYITKGVEGIPEILTNFYIQKSGREADYRPISAITFAIEHTLLGSSPKTSHLINALLYAVLCGLVFILYKKYYKIDSQINYLAFFAGLLFVVHPAHTEVVNSLKNREELLSLLFGVLSFILCISFFSKSKKSVADWLLPLLFILLACLSKLTALPFAFIAMLWGYYNGHFYKNRTNQIFAGLFLVLPLVYFGIIASLSTIQIYYYENPWSYTESFSEKLGLAFSSLWFYLKFLLYPYPFRFYYGFNTIELTTLSAPLPTLSLLLHIGLLGFGTFRFFKKKLDGFLLLSYFASIAMYANFITPYTGIVSERALFVPSLFFIPFIVLTLGERLLGQNRLINQAFALLGITILSCFSYLTFMRNFDWKDTLTLMRKDLPYLHNSTLANFFAGSNVAEEAYFSNNISARQQLGEEAKKYLKQSIINSPNYHQPYYKLGMIAMYIQNDIDSSAMYFQKAYSLDSTPTYTNYELGRVYCMLGKFNLALPLLTKVYSSQPTDTNTLYFYARALFNNGLHSEAFKINQSLIQLNSSSPFPYINEGWFWELSGANEKAVFYYKKAIDLGSQDPYLINFIARNSDTSLN
jgi:tetratricopeptide (TPR) repeat protein